MSFNNDPKDRKRRFLRGLNVLLGHSDLEDMISPMNEVISVSISEFRNRLANFYCLEFTQEQLNNIMGLTTGDFTEKYVPIIYNDRGNVDLDILARNSAKTINGITGIDITELDNAPKYGLNGYKWCDVAKGPCSCRAWH